MPTQNIPPAAVVGLVASSDAPEARKVLTLAVAELARFGLRGEELSFSSPEDAAAFARGAAGRGLKAVIVGSADPALAAVVAGETALPVVRVPVAEATSANRGMALLWPEGEASGTPPGSAFATVAIGEAGARNAALFVLSLLALANDELRDRWQEFRKVQQQTVLAATLPPD